jgi:hypothetical protein
MYITITKEFMYQEVKKILQFLFGLPELKNIIIKGVELSSLEDELTIRQAFDNCYHDIYSDVDIEINIKLK